MLISLTLKRKPQEPWGWVLWKGELAASEPPVFITAGIAQLEHQLTYFCLENMAFMPTSPVNFSYMSPRFLGRIISLRLQKSIMTETPIDKATERLLSGNFADFHIICDGCEIPVHRMIISEESRVFQSAWAGKLRVSD